MKKAMKRVMFFIACAILVTSCATGSFGLRGDRPRGGKRLYLHLEQAARLCFAEAGAEAAGGRHRERQVLVHPRHSDRDSIRGRGTW